MGRFDRYMLGLLIRMFGFFALILVSIYWVNRAVILFDTLISDGQSATVFLEFTALSLPNIIRIVLPISVFAAALYVTNRLVADSEMVVVQATGFSVPRLARPVFVFGLIVAGIMILLTFFLVPLSQSQLKAREGEIAQNLTGRLLVEGKFNDAGPGVTVYIRKILPNGEMQDVLLSDTSTPTEEIIYTAQKAYLIKTEHGSQFIMLNGAVQTRIIGDNRLFKTTFADFSYDVSDLRTKATSNRLSTREVSTWDLLTPDDALSKATGQPIARLLHEGHSRINQATLCIIAALLGFAPLLLGGFSRFGLGLHMIAATFLVIVVMGVDGVGADVAQSDPQLWPMTYLSTVVGAIIVLGILGLTIAPARQNRRKVAL